MGGWWSLLVGERPCTEQAGGGGGAGSCARTRTEKGPGVGVVAVPLGVSCTIVGTGVSAIVRLLAVAVQPAPLLGVVQREVASGLLPDATAAAAAVPIAASMAVAVAAVATHGEIRRCRREIG